MTMPSPARKPRFALARKKASELLQRAKIVSVPISVEYLAEAVRAHIRFEAFDGEMSGMVLRSPDGSAVIGVNSRHSPVRRRFSIAHEIGHLVLHEEESLHVDAWTPFAYRTDKSSEGTDPREIEANQFAAELLMPKAWIQRDMAALSTSLAEEAVERLADMYQVSMQAMTLRLHRLDLIR